MKAKNLLFEKSSKNFFCFLRRALAPAGHLPSARANTRHKTKSFLHLFSPAIPIRF
jgi:hypothetical protein